MSNSAPTQLILVDHLPGFSDSLRLAIQENKKMMIVGIAERAQDLYDGRVRTDVDIALVDMDLPDCSSFEIVQWLIARNKRLTVLTLNYWDWDSYLVGARATGAKGVLLRQAPIPELIPLIERASKGSIFTRAQSKRIQEWNSTYGGIFRSFRPHEWQILWFAAEGLSNHAIADKLDLSENTVEKLMTAILTKFNLRSRTQLVALFYNQHFHVLRCLENFRLLTLS